MILEEIKTFLQEIKTYYPNFKMNDNSLEIWYRDLSKYDKEDVYSKFDEYKKSNTTFAPTLPYITKYLLTKEEKQKNLEGDYTVQCNLCGKWMRLSEYNSHYDRCSSTSYLLLIFKKLNKSVSREELDKLDNIQFGEIYDEYTKKEGYKNAS